MRYDRRMSAHPVDATQAPLPVLLSQAGEHARALLLQRLASPRLRHRHATVLLLLRQEGDLGQQALVERLGVDPSVLVGLLNDLEADDMVQRRRDPADRRRHIVVLSQRGAEEVDTIQAALGDIERTMFVGLDDDDRAQLRRILTAVLAGGSPSGDDCRPDPCADATLD